LRNITFNKIKRKLYIYKDNFLIDFKKINKLKELHINYIILDNLEVIERKYKEQVATEGIYTIVLYYIITMKIQIQVKYL